jgi:hypothetical protein
MDRSQLWRWVRWVGLALLLFAGISRYQLQAVWGVGPALWSGTLGASGIEAAWSKDHGAAPANPQGFHFESWRRGRNEVGRWVTWVWSPSRRKIGASIPCLIMAYLAVWSAGYYTWHHQKRRLLKASAPPP